MRRSPRKSPIKDKPLRNPGQSLEEHQLDLAFNKVLGPFLLAVFVLLLAALEWWRHFMSSPPQPWIFTVLAAAVVAYAGWQVAHAWPQIRALRQGRDGERAVGQYLDRLRAKGYEVFHDIVGDGFNVDHVLIGPAGVISVETKTWSKPLRGEARIVVDGDRLLANGVEPERDPLAQARAERDWLRNLLEESTGRSLPVRAVILFPGWYVERPRDRALDVWVLNPKALQGFLEHEPKQLETENVRLAAFHLSRYVRATATRK